MDFSIINVQTYVYCFKDRQCDVTVLIFTVLLGLVSISCSLVVCALVPCDAPHRQCTFVLLIGRIHMLCPLSKQMFVVCVTHYKGTRTHVKGEQPMDTVPN